MKIVPMQVDLVDHMGSDISVVNAARVSFSKISEEFNERDAKLIQYLARHNHWTPFGHAAATLRIKAPIFVARQFVKHQVGLVWNEVSRRYVDDEPEFWFPETYRGKPINAKQGSSDEVVTHLSLRDIGTNEWWETEVANAFFNQTESSLDIYTAAIKAGVAPEQARIILPLNTMTEWIWTGSLAAWARVCKLRLDPHAQLEIQEPTRAIKALLEPLFPVSLNALLEVE
jgi:thymidylate synthase (FAD)